MNHAQLAATLIRIALGETFSMNAILAAEKLATTPYEKALLRRYRNGNTCGVDHVALQMFAIKINED